MCANVCMEVMTASVFLTYKVDEKQFISNLLWLICHQVKKCMYFCCHSFGISSFRIQWWRDLFRCRIDLLNISMGFNIVAPYMEFLHLNWYIAEWICHCLWQLAWCPIIQNYIDVITLALRCPQKVGSEITVRFYYPDRWSSMCGALWDKILHSLGILKQFRENHKYFTLCHIPYPSYNRKVLVGHYPDQFAIQSTLK